MKTLLCIPLLLMLFSGLAFGQATNVPTCTPGAVGCTDYFGVGNFANSPLPAGSISGFTLITGGGGYVNPIAVISDPTGTGFTSATFTVTLGVITAMSGSGGTGYLMPQVNIVDVGSGGSLGAPTCGGANQPVCGSGALATAILGPPFTGGMLKFQDQLIDLKTILAVPDTSSFPGADYYEIALVQYSQKMHTSLPPTTLRGYMQLPTGSTVCPTIPVGNYLGPVILAQKNRAVRVKFMNCLPAGTGGNLFIPVDTTYMGAGVGPDGKSPYLQNRATLHLHGGATPWISDGTPHQWTVPASETTATYKRGDSTAFVPDMWFDPATHALVPAGTAGAVNDPGPGNMTFYWTNEQGGRLMFYHDHAYGITRLNVYAGEAAGYLLVDPVEEGTLAGATVPGTYPADLPHLIPLVIQDKTFVPPSGQLLAQDPTWVNNFGATVPLATGSNGDLWYPHVYMPNQNPADPTGGNAFGRWDYGAWFFPPQTTLTAANPTTAVTVACTSSAFPNQTLQSTTACPTCGCPITPNPSGTPEAFGDTPVINGVAYPVLHLAPEAYRFKLLAAGNDRSWHLSWFIANPVAKTEVAMIPAVPPTSATLWPPLGPLTPAGATSAITLCPAINQVAVPSLIIGLDTGLLDATGNPLNGTGLWGTPTAPCWPSYGHSVANVPPIGQTMWAADGRMGGVPDPRAAGPAWIQIGTEGGLLPSPVVIPSTPVNYEQNTKSITITSVGVHGLWLGPAERADVIVDFSKALATCTALGVTPCTLILYNDAPAPAPAIDTRLDYFTGDGDSSPIGGAPNTQPGYGPNTRTVMQVILDSPGTGQAAFSLPTLTAALPALFKSTQPQIIVPEPTYPVASGGNSSTQSYASIQANTLTYTANPPYPPNAPQVTEPCNPPSAGCVNLDQKAIQELFTLDYGRMNATLGTEIPLTNFLTQTTIPYGYAEWATEIIQDGDTQLWKITHNGVDSHFIHFHLFNVQVVNRMGWDGSLRPPDANELGWKDTVRMNPLEDILVALQPITPVVPFPLPDSIRALDVTMPVGTPNDPTISGIDPVTGNAIAGGAGRTNALVNFGWEYVWHCHILGHEENDMMRPIIHQVAPAAPGNLVATLGTPSGNVTPVTLQWTDNSASEDSFTVQRDTSSAFLAPTSFTVTVTPANTIAFGQTVTFPDSMAPNNLGQLYYRVQANDSFTPRSPLTGIFQTVALSSAWSNIATPGGGLLTPAVTFTGAPASAAYNTSFTVTATTNAGVAPTITASAGSVCTVGAVAGTSPAMASVTMTSGTGSCVLTASWPATTTFQSATATATTGATPATPTVTFTGAPASAVNSSSFTVTATTNAGVAPTITASAGSVCTPAAVNGTSPATSLVTMTNGVGSCALTATWGATANYSSTSLTQSTTAALATTVITWATPAAIIYGTPLSAVQLNATASSGVNPVSGTFTYTPAAGTVLNAGVQTLSVTFVPTNTQGFSSASATVFLQVNPKPLTITASSSTMTYGAPVPPITAIYSGLVAPQTSTATPPVCSTTAMPTSPVGTYPSTCSGAADPNYSIAYLAGTVTVTKATSTTAVTSKPNPSIVGQIVTVTFSVAPQISGTPSGTVGIAANTGETCTGTLTAGTGSCNLTFTTGGSRTLTATYAGDTNFLGSTATLSQVVSSVSLSTTSLLFGNQVINTTSASQTVTLSNVGTTALSISGISATANFASTTNCPIGGTLRAGRSCSIIVTFRPTSVGVLTGTLTITDVDPSSPQKVSLTGTGVVATVTLTPSTFNFGTVTRRTSSAPATFTLTNTGTALLTINNISLGGANAGQFRISSSTCGTTLAAGSSCLIGVTFSPTQRGTQLATLNVSDNATGSPQSATLTGTGN